jgi:xylan 1,4-beta-xylosidase
LWLLNFSEIACQCQSSIRLSSDPAGGAIVTHARIDETHSNSYSAWLSMGSPQKPTREQYAELEKASELQALRPDRQTTIGQDGRVTETFDLPRRSVSFVKVTW